MNRPPVNSSALALLACLPFSGAQPPTRDFEPAGIGSVHVGGQIGARIDLAVRKNFLAIDDDENFLRPFRERKGKEEVKTHQERFRGLGLQIHAAVQFALYTSCLLYKSRCV